MVNFLAKVLQKSFSTCLGNQAIADEDGAEMLLWK